MSGASRGGTYRFGRDGRERRRTGKRTRGWCSNKYGELTDLIMSGNVYCV